ncbi:hypothetical protein [Planctobacterium marinum]|uniref:Uncharacterized protein n=1 Tax=Planctobacterium marinum TaxID=1631968 RepID=A0AA48HNM9_9ALTE|nr:hypothetical protein MACH26_06800 [Planctobacterium marinum]
MKVLFFFLFTFSTAALACSVPKNGYGFALEELIDEAKTVVIVELLTTTKKRLGYEHTLLSVDTIKGQAQDKYVFLSRSNDHESSTFSDHNDIRFWATDREIGRSTWPCCICGPDHTFKKGYKYLYFPDLLGAVKSAEIIRNQNDRWLLFVKARLSKATSNKGN